MTSREETWKSELAAGVCASCKHARRIVSDRGSTFILCHLSVSDKRFEKYPRLPVLSCAGFEVEDGTSTPE